MEETLCERVVLVFPPVSDLSCRFAAGNEKRHDPKKIHPIWFPSFGHPRNVHSHNFGLFPRTDPALSFKSVPLAGLCVLRIDRTGRRKAMGFWGYVARLPRIQSRFEALYLWDRSHGPRALRYLSSFFLIKWTQDFTWGCCFFQGTLFGFKGRHRQLLVPPQVLIKDSAFECYFRPMAGHVLGLVPVFSSAPGLHDRIRVHFPVSLSSYAQRTRRFIFVAAWMAKLVLFYRDLFSWGQAATGDPGENMVDSLLPV